MKNLNPRLTKATLLDYPTIQNMARFYVYEMSRECGLNDKDWAIPPDGLYESFDFKKYFIEPHREAYLIHVDDEIAGFVLLYYTNESKEQLWHIGEFFVIARFQKNHIGQRIAHEIWRKYPSQWEVSVIPENKRALNFWEKTISSFTKHVTQEQRTVDFDTVQPSRIFFTFNSSNP